MSKGWRLVARLGGTGARYPHVLADAHGWCLRLGPSSRSDEKYFSSLPMLFHGLVEHGARRRLMSLSTALDLRELRHEVQDVLISALKLCHEVLAQGGLEEHVRRLEAAAGRGTACPPSPIAPAVHPDGQAFRGPEERRQAV